MVELADIFREHGPAYRSSYGPRMLPSHLAAMRAIEQCRTEALGGHLYYCADCDESWYSYHSCRNRHCPKCQQDAAQAWLEKQHDLLLPVPYFLVTFTLPQSLRSLARTQQKKVYNLLFRSACSVLATTGPRLLALSAAKLGWSASSKPGPVICATIRMSTFLCQAAGCRPMVSTGYVPRITSSSMSNRWPGSFGARCGMGCASRDLLAQVADRDLASGLGSRLPTGRQR